ncbi:MAG: hypothetical protein H8E37_11495 [Planctomycetes bacterium]|nr:hypothetical protein [Planctomycetota bacterium]
MLNRLYAVLSQSAKRRRRQSNSELESLEPRILLTGVVETATEVAVLQVAQAGGNQASSQEPDIEFIWRDRPVGTPAELDAIAEERAALEARFIQQLQEMAELGNLTGQIAERMLDPTDKFTPTIEFSVGARPRSTIPGRPSGGLVGTGISLDPTRIDQGFIPKDMMEHPEAPQPTEQHPDAPFYIVIAHEFAHRYPGLRLVDPVPGSDEDGTVLILENTVRDELGVDPRESYNGVEPDYGTVTLYELNQLSVKLTPAAQAELSRLESFYPPVDNSGDYDVLFDTFIEEILQQAEEQRIEFEIEPIGP